MSRKTDTRIYDLEALVTLTVKTSGYDASLRWQLRQAWHGNPTKYLLRSQDRGGSQWRSNYHELYVTDALAAQLQPLFPAEQYRNSATWLTLKSICTKLGKTDVAAQMAAAEAKAKAAEAARALQNLRNGLSDWATERSRDLQRTRGRKDGSFAQLSWDEQHAVEAVERALAALVAQVPYVARLTVGQTVNVPAADERDYRSRTGIVLGIDKRSVRVDVKQADGSAAPAWFDVVDVKEAR